MNSLITKSYLPAIQVSVNTLQAKARLYFRKPYIDTKPYP